MFTKIKDSIKAIVQDQEFQKAVIVGIVNTATLVIVSAALHAATTGITNAVGAAMDKLNESDEVIVEVPPVTEM